MPHPERKRQDRISAFERRHTDGPVISAVKLVFGCGCLHVPFELFTVWWIWVFPHAESQTQEDRYRHAVEWYWLAWAGLLVFLYALLALQTMDGSLSCRLVAIIWLAAIVAAYRVVEIIATLVRLHFLVPYKTSAPSHALVLVFGAFLQVAIAFGILYMLDALVLRDRFSKDQSLLGSPINPLYFSVATLTTIGYGDFAPTRWLGKLFAMSECFMPLMLIVVALQRALNAEMAPAHGRSQRAKLK